MKKETQALEHVESIINKTTQSRLEVAWVPLRDGLATIMNNTGCGEDVQVPMQDHDNVWHYGFAMQTRAPENKHVYARGAYIKMSTGVILSYLKACYWKTNERKVRDQVIKEITERLAILPAQ